MADDAFDPKEWENNAPTEVVPDEVVRELSEEEDTNPSVRSPEWLAGHEVGCAEGVKKGYEEGLKEGKEKGCAPCYDEGHEDAVIAVRSFLYQRGDSDKEVESFIVNMRNRFIPL